MYIGCPDLTNDKFVSIYTNFGEDTYRLTFKWNEYSDCCFLSIFDGDGKEINTGNALVAGTIIPNDHRKIPTLTFLNIEGNNYEPTPETMKDYILYYENTPEK